MAGIMSSQLNVLRSCILGLDYFHWSRRIIKLIMTTWFCHS